LLDTGVPSLHPASRVAWFVFGQVARKQWKLNTSRRHGLWPCSAMQVVYVYQGMALELYSLALLKAKTEHS
jgi:hypothetical protein